MSKGVFYAAVFAVVVLAPAIAFYLTAARDFSAFDRHQIAPDAPTIITHAGGATAEGRYSNSRTALESSYAAGIRWFEVDLALTSDGKAVLLHDWDGSWTFWFGRKGVASWAEFRAAEMRGDHRQMTVGDLCLWLRGRADARVFLHMREAAIIDAVPCRERMVAFVDTLEAARRAERAGFRLTAVNVRARQLNVAQIREAIPATDFIVMENETYNAAQIAAIAREAKVVVPTVNDPDEAALLRRAGVAGIMSDVLVPAPDARTRSLRHFGSF